MLKAIIFDRDGTLLKESIHINSVVNAFDKLGIKISEEDKSYVISKHPSNYVNYLKRRHYFSKKRFLELQNEEYRRIFEESEFCIFKKNLDLLKEIKSKGYLIGLTTSSDNWTTNIFLDRLNIRKYIDAIITADECEEKKPSAKPYLLTAEKLGVLPKECLVIEDSETGLCSAKNAGMKCIIIPNEYTKNHNFEIADLVSKEHEKILRFILKLKT